MRQSFDQVEVVLYEQLSGLCRDAAWHKSYMAAELLLLKELMQVQCRGRGYIGCAEHACAVHRDRSANDGDAGRGRG